MAGAMKKLIRFTLGALSSLLLAAGLARAAEKLDPVSLNTRHGTDSVLSGTPDSVQYCDSVDKAS